MKFILLGLSPGRSGSTSLNNLIKKIFFYNKYKGTSFHHEINDPRYLHNEFHFFKKTKNSKHINNIKRKINNWKTGNCYIGASYTHVLDEILRIHKKKIKIIYLKRKKNEWLRSFVKEIKKFPWSHGNYSNYKKPIEYKIAAYHFNEMSESKWKKLSIKKKSEWLYKKNLEIFKKYKKFSISYLLVKTENLSNFQTIKKITKFMNKNWKAPKNGFKSNVSKIDFEDFKKKDQVMLSRFYNNYDFLNFAKKPLYAEKYMREKVLDGFINKKKYTHSKVSLKEIKVFLKDLEDTKKKIVKIIKK